MEQKELRFKLEPFIPGAVQLTDSEKKSLLLNYQRTVDTGNSCAFQANKERYENEAFGYQQAVTMLGYHIIEVQN